MQLRLLTPSFLCERTGRAIVYDFASVPCSCCLIYVSLTGMAEEAESARMSLMHTPVEAVEQEGPSVGDPWEEPPSLQTGLRNAPMHMTPCVGTVGREFMTVRGRDITVEVHVESPGGTFLILWVATAYANEENRRIAAVFPAAADYRAQASSRDMV